MTPFEIALGQRFHHLMPQLRQLHGGRASVWRGNVSVQPAHGILERLIARFGGFPGALTKAPFTVRVEKSPDGSELWTRDFDGHVLRSRLWVDAENGSLLEQMGPATLTLRAEVRADSLHVHLGETRLWGKWLLPKRFALQSDSVIWQDEAGRYRFEIKASLAGFGQIIRYEGWLRPDMQSAFVSDE